MTNFLSHFKNISVCDQNKKQELASTNYLG